MKTITPLHSRLSRKRPKEIVKLFQKPLYFNTISAGLPSPITDDSHNFIDLNNLLIRNKASTYYVHVTDYAMEGSRIYPGDILIIDKSIKPANDRILIASIGNDLYIRRVARHHNQSYSLKADNPSYPSLEITPASSITLWGIATFLIRSMKRNN